MIRATTSGSFSKTTNFLRRSKTKNFRAILEKYGKEGVRLLADATPKDTGQTSLAWSYEVISGKGKHSVTWYNSQVENGVHVVVAIQYGHAVQGGGYVEGRDFINPVARPLFDKLVAELWREVNNAR